MHREFRDEQQMRMFVPLARPKLQNSSLVQQRWYIPKHLDKVGSCARAVKQLKMSAPSKGRRNVDAVSSPSRSRAVLLLVCSVLVFPRVFEIY